MSEQLILPSGGCLPGIPGSYAPGIYTIDYEARTIQPYVAPPDPGTTTTQATTQSAAAPAPSEPPAQSV